MIVELPGITLTEGSEGWVIADLVGWYSMPDSKSPIDEIPQQHGAFDPGVDWRTSAAISFTAGYIGTSHAECVSAVEQFNGALANSSNTPMRVTDGGRATSRTVSVRHVGVPDFFDYDQHEVHFAVDMIAPDPFRYGDAVTASAGLPSLAGGLTFPITFPITFTSTGDPGRIVLSNEGTQETWPQFTVRGGLSDGFSLVAVETGREIRFEFPLSDTDEVTVDPRSGQAWINDPSNAVGGFLTVRDWWSVPPGASRTVQFNGLGSVSGSPLLTGVIAPAYL